MNSRSTLTGLIGGCLASFCIAIFVKNVFPGFLIDDWKGLPEILGWFSLGFSVLILAFTGFFARTINQSDSNKKVLQYSLSAGLIAGIVLFFLEIAPLSITLGYTQTLARTNRISSDLFLPIALQNVLQASWFYLLSFTATISASGFTASIGSILLRNVKVDWESNGKSHFSKSVILLFTFSLTVISLMNYLFTAMFTPVLKELLKLSGGMNRLIEDIPEIYTILQGFNLSVFVVSSIFLMFWLTKWGKHEYLAVKKLVRWVTILAGGIISILLIFIYLYTGIKETAILLVCFLVSLVHSVLISRSSNSKPDESAFPFITGKDLVEGFLLAPLFGLYFMLGSGYTIISSAFIFLSPILNPENLAHPISQLTYFFKNNWNSVFFAVLIGCLVWGFVIWPLGWTFAQRFEKQIDLHQKP